MHTRRRFLTAAAAAPVAYAAASFLPVWAQSAPALGQPTLPTPGFHRVKVGDAEIISLNDGVTRRPLAEGFVRNAPLADVRAALAAQGLPTEHLDVPYTAFLAALGGRRVLMDTGFGDWGGPTTGRVQANLQAAGVAADQVDAVVISHFHGDHINGLRLRSGAFPYSRAKVYVPEPEWAFWMDDARMEAAPAAMKPAFENVRRVFAQMPVGMLHRFAPGSEPVPGIGSIAAFGHTPGHTLFEVGRGRESFTFVADTTNVPSLFAVNPDWAVMFDMDAEAARVTRRAVFARLAAQGGLVGGYHFPGSAIGRLVAQGQGFRFES